MPGNTWQSGLLLSRNFAQFLGRSQWASFGTTGWVHACLGGQLCLTLCNSGSSVHGILQARLLEWVAIPFSKGSYRPRD